MLKNPPKNSEIAVLEVWILQKFSLPPTMVGALTQSNIKNSATKIWLHKTLIKQSLEKQSLEEDLCNLGVP